MSYNGTLNRGAGTFAAGKFTNALTAGVYYLPTLPSQAVGTIEAWVKTASATGVKIAVGGAGTSPGAPYIGISGANAAYQGPNSSLVASSVAINDNAWHHLALTSDGTNAKLWVDGVLASTTADTFTVVYGSNYAIGGLGTNTTFDWSGAIDEVRLSNNVRYTTGFTPPVAAFTDDANTVALYHLEADATDSHVSTGPTIGTISVSTSAGTDTISYPAPTAGSFTVAGVSLYVGTTPGGENATAVSTNAGTGSGTFTHATGFYYFVKAFDNQGTPNFSSASNEVFTAATTVLPTDANVLYSPYNWRVASSVAKSINPGAYLQCLVSGSNIVGITATFDMTNMLTPVSEISYRIDGAQWTDVTVAASVALTMPGDAWSKHLVEIRVKSTTETQNRWNGPQNTAVVLTGLIFSGNSSVTTVAVSKRVLNVAVFGDSITEGVRTQSSTATNDVDRNNAGMGWAYQLREALGAEVGVVGFGGQGISVGGSGNVPIFGTSLASLWASQARTWTPVPDLIVINEGTNDGVTNTVTAMTAALNAFLAACGTATLIAVMRPFNGNQATNLQSAIAACNSPSQVKYIDTTGWFNTADSSDSLHPYGYTDLTNIGPLLAAALRTFLKRGAMTLAGASSGADKIVSPVLV